MLSLTLDETIKLVAFPAFMVFGYFLFRSKGLLVEKHIKRFSGTPGRTWNFFYSSDTRLMHHIAPEAQTWIRQVQRKLFTYFGIALMIIGLVGIIGSITRVTQILLSE